ncbi:hypothetical protein EJ05DRAFT_437949 [Pseudovirgaria hyperparasitica]|uniref:N-acetyltransferase domain-containing protein n=1 Tax=Pseudovirgaria hyperparasitica TaxID=470096 RepID=A0A6A6WB76_9PEZI|nr:uncharacterized protein EJ05DRAFT_437949 [Pseudovirgaria hyperparasitica]KAF2759294.1 hypothetical protein EJ05DRAFT_437949 [Pseudovirgaria hyperparasitica]
MKILKASTDYTPAIVTPKVLLVPYSRSHVPTYHTWMQDAELQEATASEPLTLEQEFDMQQSWRVDGDKLTFIACTAPAEDVIQGDAIRPTVFDGPDQMIGDVNLFVAEADLGDDEGDQSSPDAGLVGEIEIMIARKDIQGKGYGRAVLLTFLWYILIHLSVKQGEQWRARLRLLRVKVGKGNVRSIRLFQSVGFMMMNETPNYFGELELTWDVGNQSIQQLQKRLRDSSSGWQEPRIKAYR